jgi:hypothetical protein
MTRRALRAVGKEKMYEKADSGYEVTTLGRIGLKRII